MSTVRTRACLGKPKLLENELNRTILVVRGMIEKLPETQVTVREEGSRHS